MAVQVQFRRGTKAQHDAFTGATGEITVNTTDKTLVMHDGTTLGGFNLARADGDNLDLTGLSGITTIPSVAIDGGTVNNTTIGIGTSANGNFTNVNMVDVQVGSAISVGAATTFKELLVVNGDARVTGILTIGTGTITIDGDNNELTIGGQTITGDGDANFAGILTAITIDATTLDAGSNLYAVVGVVTTLTSTNATITDLNVTADARVGAALTVTGDLDIDGQAIFDDITVSAASTFTGAIDANGGANISGGETVLSSATVSDLTDNRVVLAGASGALEDSANLTFDGATLAVTGNQTVSGTIDVDGQAIFDDITVSAASTFTGAVDMNGGLDVSGAETVLSSATVSDLTSGRVVLAGTSGALEDSGNLTFNGTTLSAPTADLTNATIDNLTFTSGTAITSVDTDLSSVSASDDSLASAKAIKTYVDAQITAQDLDFAGGTGTGAVDLDSQSLTIAGTTNEIETSASGQTLTIGLPNDVTIGQDLTIGRDVLISRNLNVTGNVTIGGTSATIFASELKVADADIVLGFRTDGSGNDISNDTTADHGGVAVASTEGTPLVSLYNPGIGESNPATYKKIMWFKTGAFSGLGTDAWLSNYAIGIGSTQVPNNVVLAAGAVNITNNDISYVRNISAASSITASTFFGDGSGLENTGATLSAASGSQRVVLTSLTSGTMTTAATEAALAYNATSDTLTAGTFSGSGASLTGITNSNLSGSAGITNANLANSTISGVSLGSNLNTLTMNVSGSGLSGSQTYNGSGAATFTVTSNATNGNTASTIVARDASGNFSAGTITASLSGTATQVSNTLTRGSYLTGSNYNGSAATTWAVDATSANTASKVVARDGSGNFSAGTITATLSGNASTSSSCSGNAATATTLQTARTINGVSFNGSGNITVEAYIENDESTAATRYITFVDNTTASFKRLNEDSSLTYNPSTNVLSAGTFSGSGASLTSLNGSNISSGTIAAARVATLNQNTTGNAATATTLQTARTINGVSFNGSANITVEPYIEDDNGTNATRYIVFTDNSSGGFKRLNEDSTLTYNPSSNTLTTGTVTATSDIKLKENVTTIENGLDKVCQLRGVEFDFKSNGQHSLGVIAQEVEQVLPDLVSEVDGTKTVAYANLTAVLIEAVKELKAEVAELRSRLDG